MRQWVDRSIKDLCVAIVDCVNKTAPSQTDPTPYKMLRTTNVRGGWVDTANVKYVDEPTYAKWTRRLVPEPGDIILTREAPFGGVGMLRSDDRVFLGQRLVMYRPDLMECDPNFLMYSMMGPTVQAELKSLGSGSTVEHLRVPDCEKITVPCPSLDDQRRIGSILRSLDDLIENNRRRVEVLEEMARAIYREWFVKFRYPGREDVPLVDSALGPIPSGWTAGTIGDVIELKYGKALKANARRGGEVAVVSSAGIVGWHDQSVVAGPAIVVGRKGNVGSVHWVDVACWPIDTAYYVTTDLPLRFVVEHLRRTEFTNSHAAVPGLSRESAYARPFVVPPTKLLSAFQDAVDPLGDEASALSAQADKLAALRDLLLPKLVTGQIDVSSLELDAMLTEVDLDAMVGEQVA